MLCDLVRSFYIIRYKKFLLTVLLTMMFFKCFLILCGTVAAATSISEVASRVSIEQTLNTFSHSVDAHDYDLLDAVFAPDAIANFRTSAGIVSGLENIKAMLNQSLAGTVSHHSLGTITVNFDSSNGTSATTSTYLEGTFFGQGNLTGQICTTYGRYVSDPAFLA